MSGRGLLLVALAAALTVLIAGVSGAFSPTRSSRPDLQEQPLSPVATMAAGATAVATLQPTVQSDTPVPTVIPSPTPSPRPPAATTTARRSAASYFANGILISVYGRAFGTTPAIGRLGNYRDFADMAADLGQFIPAIAPLGDGKTIVPTIQLVYAQAAGCDVGGECPRYLESTGVDLARDYILPASQRGWQVILDTQIGPEDPVDQVQRMIDQGYLNYDNVHVALDPSFAAVGPDSTAPPKGAIDAARINEIQRRLDEHVRRLRLQHRKVLIIHQAGDSRNGRLSIGDPERLATYENVDLVIEVDIPGAPGVKVAAYNQATDPEVATALQYRGLRVFLPNPGAPDARFDLPGLPWSQALGIDETPDGQRVRFRPDLLVIS
jgi:hypothetical protein